MKLEEMFVEVDRLAGRFSKKITAKEFFEVATKLWTTDKKT